MKTKTILFDLETAKKIQAGDITGSIKTKNGLTCKIVSYCDGTDFFVERKTEVGYCRWCYPYTQDGRYIDGKNNGGTDYDLVLEVSDNEPQFKPFDKVLVRMDGKDWTAAIYSHYDNKIKHNYHYVANGAHWEECILYAGNEHLVGTTDKPKDG